VSSPPGTRRLNGAQDADQLDKAARRQAAEELVPARMMAEGCLGLYDEALRRAPAATLAQN
jgi:hypothetical protein